MGILNVTPDSFSDGGRYDTVEAAVAHGLRLAAGRRRLRRRRGRVDAARRRPRRSRGGAPAGPAGRRRTRLARASRSASTRPGRGWPTAALEAGAVHGERRQRRPGRSRHGPRRRRRRRPLGAHAPAWRQPRHVRRGRRTTTWWPTCGGSCADGSTPRWRRAWRPSGSSSTRASASPSSPSTTSPCWPAWTASPNSASPSWSGPPASASSAPCSRRRTGAPAAGRRDDATLATSVLAARAGAWGVRVHDVAGSADAACASWPAWALAAPDPADPTHDASRRSVLSPARGGTLRRSARFRLTRRTDG